MMTPDSPDHWFAACTFWPDEVAALRRIVLATGLVETIKWKHPCYTDHGRNIFIIGTRKAGAVASFLKGALLDEPQGRFIQPGQERSGRYLSYTSVEQIEADRPYLERLLAQAVEVERAGLRVEPLPDEIDYCDELRERLDTDDAYREAFEALTPGRRRGYNLHFSRAKRASTRRDRVERSSERVFLGKGLMDCICGRSKRMPRCDGTHNTPPPTGSGPGAGGSAAG